MAIPFLRFNFDQTSNDIEWNQLLSIFSYNRTHTTNSKITPYGSNAGSTHRQRSSNLNKRMHCNKFKKLKKKFVFKQNRCVFKNISEFRWLSVVTNWRFLFCSCFSWTSVTVCGHLLSIWIERKKTKKTHLKFSFRSHFIELNLI